MDNVDWIENVLEHLEFTGDERGERKGITFWVTPEEHAAYHKLQMQSNKNFGKSFERLLKKVLAIKGPKVA